jgi:formate dehydrogenase maturation protein FdhE
VEISGDIDNRIFARLKDWEDKGGPLPVFVEYYRELMEIQREIESETVLLKPGLAADLLSDHICEGIPLLLFGDFQPDWQQVQESFEQMVMWTAKDGGISPEEKEDLNNLGHNLPLLKTLLEKRYLQDSFQGIQEVKNFDSELLTSITAAALKPFLRAYSKRLLPEVDQEQWRRPYCPICGSKPDFSYLDRDKGARWLVCSWCDAEWLFWRLVCPYCGTHDQNKLSYFADEEGSNLYRLYICKQCSTYIKSIDLRFASPDVLLPLERLMTMNMDKQAQELGYRPGWLGAAKTEIK